MNTAAKVLGVSCVGLVLSGCQIAPVVHLINMSGHEVTVFVLDEEFVVAPRGVVEFGYGDMAIRYERCALTYIQAAPPKIEDPRYGGFRQHINRRLDPNGSVVMLPSTKEA